MSSQSSVDSGQLSRGKVRVLYPLVMLSFLTAYCLLPTAYSRAEELKIGYVNLGKLFDQYQRTKESDQVLEQKGKQKQAELEDRVTELKKLRQNLELLNDQAKESKAKELEEKSDEFQRAKTRTERDLVRERNQLARTIMQEIEQVVGDYAKANHFAMIVDQRSLLYGQDAYDVTDAILKVLNERYTDKANKAPAAKPSKP